MTQEEATWKINNQGIAIDDTLEGKKYIIVCRKFEGVNASACPLVGQVATNNRLLAYFLYWKLNRWSHKTNGYSIAVMLVKRNSNGNYDAIKR